MKTKKKCGIFAALAAVLLISAVLVTSCPESLSLGGLSVPQANGPNFQPPEGTGYVRLSFGGERAARTIRPAAGDFATDAEDFAKFTVFFKGDGNSDAGPFDIDNGPGAETAYDNLLGRVFVIGTATQVAALEADMEEGDYFIEVWAYDNAGAAVYTGAVAYGISAKISVDADTSDTVPITLAAIRDATVVSDTAKRGEGTFAWAIPPLDTSIDEVLLTITTYPDGDPVTATYDDGITPVTGAITDLDITSDLSNSIDLVPGFYNVYFALSGTGVKEATIRETLHIYQGMDSTYSTALPALNPNVYTITYQFNDDDTADEDETLTHGDVINGPSEDPRQPSFYPGNIWLGWWTEDGTSDDEWGILADKGDGGVNDDEYTYRPIKTQTLYGRWQPAGIKVTITWSPPEFDTDPVITATATYTVLDPPNPPSSSTVPLTDGDIIYRDDPPVITFSAAADSGSLTNYQWSITTVPGLTGIADTFDVDLGDPDYMDLLIQGKLIIQLTVDNGDDLGLTATYTIEMDD